MQNWSEDARLDSLKTSPRRFKANMTTGYKSLSLPTQNNKEMLPVVWGIGMDSK